MVAVLALVAVVAMPQTARAASVAASYPVGSQPFGVAVDPADGRVFVANNGGSTVSVVDPATGSVTSLDAGPQPGVVAFEPVSRRLYVSNSGDQSLTILDVVGMRQVMTVSGAGGLGVAVNADKKRAYVAGGGVLSIVSTTTGLISSSIFPAPDESWFGVAVDPALHRIFVTNIQTPAPSLHVFDDTTFAQIATVPLPQSVRFALAVDGTTHNVYLASDDPVASEFYVVDGSTFALQSFPFGGSAGGMALAPGKHRIYVTDASNRRLVEIDDQSFAVVGTTPLPWEPAMLATHPDGRVYVAGRSANVVGAVANNTPPVIDALSLSPASPLTNGVVQASVVAHDADADALTYTYEWSRNGTVIAGATGSSLDLSVPGNGDRGDTIGVRVVVSDGQSTDEDSTSVVVGDTAPTVAVSLSATSLSTSSVVTATARGADADRDSLSYSFTWKVNGLVRKTTSGPNASDSFDLGVAGNGDPGDTLVVDVVASDGTLSSDVATASANVTNTPPTVSVSLNTSTPRKNFTLVAAVTGFDADGDPLTYTYTWLVNGVVKRSVTTDLTTDTLVVRQNASNGDQITVTVVASDGLASSAPASDSAVVTPGGSSSDH